jgi:AraC-like DNA-binding protein
VIKQYLSYSGIRRIFLGLFITIFLGVNAGSGFLYYVFSETLLSGINTGTARTLKKIKNGTELVYNEIISLLIQLSVGEPTLTKMMFETERDRLLEYQGHQIMQRTAVSHPFIDYIGIYNERLDEIMATWNLSVESRETLKLMVNYYFRRSPNNLTIPLTSSRTAPEPAANTIVLIMYSPLSLDNDKGAVIFGINCGYFQRLIREMDEGDLETVMILHGSGRVITHPDRDQELLDYSGRDFIRKILENKQNESGFFIEKINEIETYISFTCSDTLDWIFISMTPYENMISALNSLRRIALIITFVILCTGILISYFMAITMYRPIHRLLRRFNYVPARKTFINFKGEDAYLEQQIDHLRSAADISGSLIRNYTVLSLLKNQNIDDSAVSNTVLETAFKSPFYIVCLISLDDQQDYERQETKEIETLRQAIAGITNEILRRCSDSLDYAAVSSSETVFIPHLEDGVYPPEMVPGFIEIGITVKKYCGRSVSIAVSSIINSIYALNDAYEEVRALMKERFFNGPGLLLMKESAVPRKEIEYPNELGEQLCAAVLSGESGKIDKIISQFITILKQTTYDYARMYINMLMMRLLSQSLSINTFKDTKSFYSLFHRLQTTETLEKTFAEFSAFCHSLTAEIKHKSSDSMAPLVKDAISLMEKHYTDTLFSVNSAAEYFNITPSYFNRIFKKAADKSFSEYLSEYRMDAACTLLRETNNPIGSIPEAVGISNANYFYTLFKKIYRLTPQQYRHIQKN